MKQPEALRLAELMSAMDYEDTIAAAAELRRQNGEIESMRAERIIDIKRIKQLHEANQAMLEALKKCRSTLLKRGMPTQHDMLDAAKTASAAIAKAEQS